VAAGAATGLEVEAKVANAIEIMCSLGLEAEAKVANAAVGSAPGNFSKNHAFSRCYVSDCSKVLASSTCQACGFLWSPLLST